LEKSKLKRSPNFLFSASAKAASEVRSPPKVEAAPTPAVENNVGAAAAAAIDEDLFDDEDLDELDENLENLQI